MKKEKCWTTSPCFALWQNFPRVCRFYKNCYLSSCSLETKPITCQCMEFQTEECFYSQIFLSFFFCEILVCINLARGWEMCLIFLCSGLVCFRCFFQMLAEHKLVGCLTLKVQSRQNYSVLSSECKEIHVQRDIHEAMDFCFERGKRCPVTPRLALCCWVWADGLWLLTLPCIPPMVLQLLISVGAGTSPLALGLSPCACGTGSSCMKLVRVAGCASVLSVSTWRKKISV